MGNSQEIYDGFIWKEFIVGDLFDIKSGSSKTSPEPGDYVIVTGKTIDNGVNGSYPTYNQENIFTIASVGSNCGTSFWHPYKFHLGANVLGLTPKFKANKWNAQFICTCIDKLKVKYAYGKTASVGRIKTEKIWIPTKDGEVDYDFMERYIKSLNFSEVLG